MGAAIIRNAWLISNEEIPELHPSTADLEESGGQIPEVMQYRANPQQRWSKP